MFMLCVIIPTYNNAQTLSDVINSVLAVKGSQEIAINAVIVVNDGSTDCTMNILQTYTDVIKIVTYDKNRGKGYALSRGFDHAQSLNCTHAITIDSDGQHFADDIPKFIHALLNNSDSLIVGSRNLRQKNMPKQNSFANKFSNFWFCVQTLQQLPDTQTGFRLYPLSKMQGLRPISSRYEAELELLIRSAWRGISLISIPVEVYYPNRNERITNFRPCIDFVRISILNTIFVILAIVYGYPNMLIRRITQTISRLKK
jgi:glycosyltransferase involved in cell wall biosynthesis